MCTYNVTLSNPALRLQDPNKRLLLLLLLLKYDTVKHEVHPVGVMRGGHAAL